MLSVLFGRKTLGKIGELTLDATLYESHDYINQITRFPVEDGADISDHIKQEPDTYTVEGFITNSPINLLQRIADVNRDLSRSEVSNNVELALDALLKISGRTINGEKTAPQLVTVVSGLRVYKEMALEVINIPVNPRTGQAMNFTAKLTEFRKVESITVEIEATAAVKTVPKGRQKTIVPVTTEEEEKVSWAKQLFIKAVR